MNETSIIDILIVGGVSSIAIYARNYSKNLTGQALLAKTEWSSDNAIGVALMTEKRYYMKDKSGTGYPYI
jgi:tRNA A37 threonylcarbamoyltransferase TsaD